MTDVSAASPLYRGRKTLARRHGSGRVIAEHTGSVTEIIRYDGEGNLLNYEFIQWYEREVV